MPNSGKNLPQKQLEEQNQREIEKENRELKKIDLNQERDLKLAEEAMEKIWAMFEIWKELDRIDFSQEVEAKEDSSPRLLGQ